MTQTNQQKKRTNNTLIGVCAAILLLSITVGVIIWLSVARTDSNAHLKQDKTCSELPRRGIKEKLLKQRNRKNAPSDVTFAREEEKENWNYFVAQHYDWWMFPWKADKSDSLVGKEWSVLEGDVVDLLNTNGFVDKYVKGAEILIKAFEKSDKESNPINGRHVSPARYPKIYCSIKYFKEGAKFINDQSKVDALDRTLRKLLKHFHQPKFQNGKDCGSHVWKSPN